MTVRADAWRILAACGLRNLAYGALSVVLGLHLAALGLTPAAIGALFTVALAGSAAVTVAASSVADRVGRRRLLLASSLLMAAGGALFAVAEQPWLLALAAALGTVSPSGKEVGPFLALEQAALPQTTTDAHRTGLFARYNLVGSLAGAVGSLAAGLPAALGVAPEAGYRLLLWGYAAAGLVLALLFARLTPAIEAAGEGAPGRFGLHRSRRLVAKLAALFALDALAGGFVVQGLVAYWFHLRFGVAPETLGAIFFGANLASALSYLAAAPLARRIGLLYTMVFTHLPSNILLVLVPFMPTLPLAVGMLVARHLLSQLDVPTRQSYTMAVVEPEERAAAAGLTAVARYTAVLGPALAGPALAVPALGIPFLVAGGLKIVYDLALLVAFRHVRPPEERARAAAPARAGVGEVVRE